MFDLSIVTDTLRDILSGALGASPLFGGNPPPFSVAVSSQHPADVLDTSGADCDVNLYLFHISEDRDLRNQFWTQKSITGQPPGPARQPVAFEPLCLDLYFLLTAHSQSSYSREQQVMSIGMRAFHENTIVRLATPTPTGVTPSEITLSLEDPSFDELSRLWQALGVPLRMTAQYKATVAMLTPESGAADPPNPSEWALLPAPVAPVNGDRPMLFGTIRRVRFQAPLGPGTYDLTPATGAPAPAGAPDQEITLRGVGVADADKVFLVTTHADGTQTKQEISAWKQPLANPYPSLPPDGVPLRLRPDPATCPDPGRYMLCVGRPGDPTWRSNPVPVSIAPWIDPSGGPLLTPTGAGVYSCPAVNVPASGAQLRLGTVPLSRRASGTPNPGQWVRSGGNVRFRPPPSLPSGNYAVRLRVNDIEADPALWAVI
jgi:Pvc16 N-terminal domain